jgi:putative ABC transport system permease protein
MTALLEAYLPEIYMGLSSLLVHKLRTLLTMLGMIFGVGAVVAMLAITAGVEKEMLSYIDLLGVNNIIIEAKEATDRTELQARRAISPGMTFRDYRAILENTQGIDKATPRKRFKPTKVLPKTTAEPPMLIGVEPSYLDIQSIRLVEGRFFTEEENATAAPVCVLGESAKVNLLGFEPAVGKYVKINDVWLQVIGVLAQQADGGHGRRRLEILQRNNLVVIARSTP